VLRLRSDFIQFFSICQTAPRQLRARLIQWSLDAYAMYETEALGARGAMMIDNVGAAETT